MSPGNQPTLLQLCVALAVLALAQSALALSSQPDRPADRYGRAPYPWFDEDYQRSTHDAAYSRPTWYEVDWSFWSPDNSDGGYVSRVLLGAGFFSVNFEQQRLRRDRPEDADIQKWSFGAGYLSMRDIYALNVSAGATLLDTDVAFDNDAGIHARIDARLFPAWPLSVGAHAQLDLIDSESIVDVGGAVQFQLFRASFLSVGWRYEEHIEEGGFKFSGLTIGLNLSFGDLSRLFIAPKSGWGDGVLSLFTGRRPFG